MAAGKTAAPRRRDMQVCDGSLVWGVHGGSLGSLVGLLALQHIRGESERESRML